MPNYSFLVFKNYSKKGLFISFLTTYLVIFNLLFIFQKSWVGELWISFLPYWLVLSIIFTIILLGFVIFKAVFDKLKKSQLNPKNPGLNIFCGFVVVVSCFSNSILSFKIYNYFYQQPQVEVATQVQNGLKIGFFNILETNTEYNLINTKLQDLDIVSFAEFQENHYQNLPFLKTYRHSFPKTFPKVSGNTTTIAIFSKLEFSQINYKKLIHNNALIAKFDYNNSTYELIVNHLSNPFLPRFYENRNQDLAYLSRLLEDKKDDKVLILGDFNITPWSPYYPKFDDYNNVLAGRGVYVTWQVGPFVLPIDQMFSSQSLEILNYKIDTQNGSDHHLIWTTVV